MRLLALTVVIGVVTFCVASAFCGASTRVDRAAWVSKVAWPIACLGGIGALIANVVLIIATLGLRVSIQ